MHLINYGALSRGWTEPLKNYDEFGNLEQTGASGFLHDVTFTGSVSDTSSGLQYMNARYYQPSTGRFLTQDSYKGNPYDPWTQHLYSYCGNNPTNMVDPRGHSPWWLKLMKFARSAIDLNKVPSISVDAWMVGFDTSTHTGYRASNFSRTDI